MSTDSQPLSGSNRKRIVFARNHLVSILAWVSFLLPLAAPSTATGVVLGSATWVKPSPQEACIEDFKVKLCVVNTGNLGGHGLISISFPEFTSAWDVAKVAEGSGTSSGMHWIPYSKGAPITGGTGEAQYLMIECEDANGDWPPGLKQCCEVVITPDCWDIGDFQIRMHYAYQHSSGSWIDKWPNFSSCSSDDDGHQGIMEAVYDMEIVACTDDSHCGYQEFCFNNNCLPEQPDVAAYDVWIEPSNPAATEEVVVHAEVCNVGEGDTSKDIEVRFKIDGATCDNDGVVSNGLGKDDCAVVESSPTACSPDNAGVHQVTVVVDPLNKISESNLENNSLTESFSWTAPPSCSDPGLDGTCTSTQAFFGETECHSSDGANAQPYKCVSYGDLTCWSQVEVCQNAKYCFDPPGFGEDDGAQCVECYDENHCGSDGFCDTDSYTCVECSDQGYQHGKCNHYLDLLDVCIYGESEDIYSCVDVGPIDCWDLAATCAQDQYCKSNSFIENDTCEPICDTPCAPGSDVCIDQSTLATCTNLGPCWNTANIDCGQDSLCIDDQCVPTNCLSLGYAKGNCTLVLGLGDLPECLDGETGPLYTCTNITINGFDVNQCWVPSPCTEAEKCISHTISSDECGPLCDAPCDSLGDTYCDGDELFTCTSLGPCSNWVSNPCGQDHVCENGACKYWPDEVEGTLTGQITFDDVKINLLGIQGWELAPLIGTEIVLVDAAGDSIGPVTFSDSDGMYELSFSGIEPGSLVGVQVRAENDVVQIDSGWGTYEYLSELIDVGVGGSTSLDVYIPGSGFDDDAIPFRLFDAIQVAHEYATEVNYGGEDISKVKVVWPTWLFSALKYESLLNTIHVPEGDDYLLPLLLHEYGHHVQYHWTGSDYAVSWDGHAPCTPMETFLGLSDEAELAWNEGFASYFAAAVQNAYPDRILSLADPWWVYEPGNPNLWFNLENPIEVDGCQEYFGPVDEASVAAILWDIHDLDATGETWDVFNDPVGETRIFMLVSSALDTWGDVPDICEFLYAWNSWGWDLQEIEPILNEYEVYLTDCNGAPEILAPSPTEPSQQIVEGDCIKFSASVDDGYQSPVWAEWSIDGEVVKEDELPIVGEQGLPPGTMYTHKFIEPGQYLVTLTVWDDWGVQDSHQWEVDVEEWIEPAFEPVTASSLPIVSVGWKSITMGRTEEDAGIYVVMSGPAGPYEVGDQYSFELDLFVSDGAAYQTGCGGCFIMNPLYVLGCGQSWVGVAIPADRVTLVEDTWTIDAEWKCDWCDEQEDFIVNVFKTVWTVKKYAVAAATGGAALVLYEAVEAGIEWVATELVELAWEAAFGEDDASEIWQSSSAGFEASENIQVWSTNFIDPDDPECWQGGIATISFDVVFNEPGLTPISAVFDLWSQGMVDKGTTSAWGGGCAPYLVGDPTFNPETLIQHFRQITYLAEVVGGACGDLVCSADETCESCPTDCPDCQTPCGNGICDADEDCSNCMQDCMPCCGNDICEEELEESCLSCPLDCGACCGDDKCISYHNETCASCPGDCGSCCGDGYCATSLGEDCDSCPTDCGPCCGNDLCNAAYGENCFSCPADCGECPPQCGDGDCLGGENCALCPVDCGSCCGDGQCAPNHGETCDNCPTDCGACCGDGQCVGNEDCLSCPGDCGDCCGDQACSPMADESCDTCPEDCGECPIACGDGDCKGTETCVDCSLDCGDCCGDAVCSALHGETCSNCPADCGACCGNELCETTQGETCVSCFEDCGPCCGNGACSPASGETCSTCPEDCGQCCGNGACEPGIGEGCTTCPLDCGECVTCGDGACEESESCASCSEDCGQCCGDGACSFVFGETCATCSADCGECCGDSSCDELLGETCDSCPADCGECCGDDWCQEAYDEDCATCPVDCGECCGDSACEVVHGEDCETCEADCGLCPPICGDGEAEQYEECDDGNLNNDDGCSDECTWEVPKIGSVIVTELMPDPDAVSEMHGEWIELYNTEKFTIDIDGWILADEGADEHVIDAADGLAILPGSYLVLGANADPVANGGAPVDYVYSGVFLLKSDDEIILSSGDLLIDAFAWDDVAFPNEPGRALNLHPQSFDDELNDAVDSWCLATTLMSGGDFGTPGAPNTSCFAYCGDGVVNLVDEQCDDGNNSDGDGCSSDCVNEILPDGCGDGDLDPGEDCDDGNALSWDGCGPDCTWEPPTVCGDGIKAPWEECDDGNTDPLDGCSPSCQVEGIEPGVLVITEIMVDPKLVSDMHGEWFEIYNTTSWPIDINGWVIESAGDDNHTIDAGGSLLIDPGQSALLGVDGNPDANGGVDLNYVYGADIKLSVLYPDGLALRTEPDGMIIDEVWYDDEVFPIQSGYSMALSNSHYSHEENDLASNWCLASPTEVLDSGDYGSPGAVNTGCSDTICGDGNVEGNETCDEGASPNWGCCEPDFCLLQSSCCGNDSCEQPMETCFTCEADCGPCPCAPDCANKSCLDDDGCGAPCGCSPDLVCCDDGSCKTECACVPDCTGMVCGPDGCGGSCGECPTYYVCMEGACICVPDCGGAACGDDGCGGSCGECSVDKPFCEDGQCVFVCEPNCTDKECGDDGCGGSCGFCNDEQYICSAHECVCLPNCTGKQCGDDSCGGSCGTCDQDQFVCVDDQCTCVPDCAQKDCGDDGCDGSCGECEGPQDVCETGVCICIPECTGIECGPDGCGGSCGECPNGQVCSDDGTSCESCDTICAGVDCGETEGCDCGACDAGNVCQDGVCVEEVPQDSCAGACGGQAPAGCYCDNACIDYGDCCADVCDQCPDLSHCGGACVPDCTGKVCGDDGCEGTCGECPDGQVCDSGGTACLGLSCADVTCGEQAPSGCWCDSECEASDDCCPDRCDYCAEWCTGNDDCVATCGTSVCGTVETCNCGTCPPGETCQEGACVPDGPCVPNCNGLSCGDDGCSGSCGTCNAGFYCEMGNCVEGGAPDTDKDTTGGDVVAGGSASTGSCSRSGLAPVASTWILLLSILCLAIFRRVNT